jgi:hypothetical protein
MNALESATGIAPSSNNDGFPNAVHSKSTVQYHFPLNRLSAGTSVQYASKGPQTSADCTHLTRSVGPLRRRPQPAPVRFHQVLAAGLALLSACTDAELAGAAVGTLLCAVVLLLITELVYR